jgi:hypothetical protein
VKQRNKLRELSVNVFSSKDDGDLNYGINRETEKS